MTVGVIITVFNLERYIAEAILSVLDQSRKADKILVINDGSSDNSIAIISKFSDQVQIIENDGNKGVLPSLISGIKTLDTDIIAFLDGDDRWAPDKLKHVMQVFETDDTCMLVTHSYRRMDAKGKVETGKDKTLLNLERIEKLNGSVQEADKELKKSILSYKGVWLGSAFSIKKKCLDVFEFEKWSKGIWGHELSHQDQPLATFLILNNPMCSIRYIKEKLFDYRLFGDNSSGSSTTQEKALQTLKRSKATILRTHQVVQQMNGRNQELMAQAFKLSEIEYLESLYTKNWSRAAKNFFSLLFSFWNLKESGKEIVRFSGVIFLGVDRVLKYK